MAALTPPICDFDWPAPDFALLATDGRTYSRDDLAGPNGTLILFICNHCPFVLAILDRLIRGARALQGHGVGVAAGWCNDPVADPAPDCFGLYRSLGLHYRGRLVAS